MVASEPQHQPSVGGHERVAVDVPAELIGLGVLPSFVLEGDLPARVAQIRVGHFPAHRSRTGTCTSGSGRSLSTSQYRMTLSGGEAARGVSIGARSRARVTPRTPAARSTR